jgi:hypothetical protein
MSNEISLTASLTVNKPSVMSSALSRAVTGVLFNMSGNFLVEGSISLATSDTLIPLGQVTSPHWAFFHNMDTVNFLKLKTASAGAYFARLLAGEYAFFPLLDTNAAIMGIADTAAIQLEYLILSL